MQPPTQPNQDKKPSRRLFRVLVASGVALLIGFSPLPPTIKHGLLTILRDLGALDLQTPVVHEIPGPPAAK